jgi:hypothetical protein
LIVDFVKMRRSTYESSGIELLTYGVPACYKRQLATIKRHNAKNNKTPLIGANDLTVLLMRCKATIKAINSASLLDPEGLHAFDHAQKFVLFRFSCKSIFRLVFMQRL